MPGIDKMVRSEIRKLARQGRLIDEAFKAFQRAVFPGAAPDQVHAMRVCFFAGGQEVFTLCMAGLDDGVSETEGDMVFMSQWTEELETFHARTIATARAGGQGQ